MALLAFTLCAAFYLWEYAVRAAPGVMTGELTSAWGLSTLGIGTVIGLYYYTYSPFALVAGASVDHFGAKRTIPLGVVVVAVGCLMFSSGVPIVASIGRLMQGAGSAFAFIGCIYVATRYLPAKHLALLVGIAQMFGLAGGWCGQKLASIAIVDAGWPWQRVWIASAVIGLAITVVLYFLLPRESQATDGKPHSRGEWLRGAVHGYREVLSNPRTIAVSVVAALLFAPTTIGSMIWGTALMRDGFGMDAAKAATVTAMVPLGWVVGCPLLGFVSDRMGRRKPVLIAGSAGLFGLMVYGLFGHAQSLPHGIITFAIGVCSGASMLPYTMVKEVNPPRLAGSATGAINCLVFLISAMLSPLVAYVLSHAAAGSPDGARHIADYQAAFTPLIAGTLLATVMSVFLPETGPAAHFSVAQGGGTVRPPVE